MKASMKRNKAKPNGQTDISILRIKKAVFSNGYMLSFLWKIDAICFV
jgi:hypothetical protein